MSTATDEGRRDGVEFVYEGDGRVTARDVETGVASYGDSKAEALAMLAEALELHEDGGEPVTDDDLREFDLDPAEDGDEELPEFMK